MSAFMLAGIVGRVAWQALADRTRRGSIVLAALGIGSGSVAPGFAAMGPNWQLWLVLGFCALAGFTAIA
jgi:hypothetical protein